MTVVADKMIVGGKNKSCQLSRTHMNSLNGTL
jgi:hypothetical protein